MFSHNMAGAPNLLSFAQRTVNYKRLNGTCNVIAHGKADNNPRTTTKKYLSRHYLFFFLSSRQECGRRAAGETTPNTHKTLCCVCVFDFFVAPLFLCRLLTNPE
jgi:hypothetical protein